MEDHFLSTPASWNRFVYYDTAIKYFISITPLNYCFFSIYGGLELNLFFIQVDAAVFEFIVIACDMYSTNKCGICVIFIQNA